MSSSSDVRLVDRQIWVLYAYVNDCTKILTFLMFRYVVAQTDGDRAIILIRLAVFLRTVSGRQHMLEARADLCVLKIARREVTVIRDD